MKINLEKACIGFLIGILLFCVCNKMFLIEGFETDPVNSCRDRADIKNPDTCDAVKRCYDSTNGVCTSVGNELLPNEELAIKKCTDAGFIWCGLNDRVETCDTVLLKDLCLTNKTYNECMMCAGTHQSDLWKFNCVESDLVKICNEAEDSPPSPPAPGPTPPGPTPPSGGINIVDQDDGTVQIVNNTSENPLHIYFKYGDAYLSGGEPWKTTDGKPLTEINLYNNPENELMTRLHAILGPKSIYYELKLYQNESSILRIPNFDSDPHNKFRISPVRYVNELPVKSTEEMPILIEAGKDAVGNMSAVDGINFKVKYEINDTEYESVRGTGLKNGPTTIEVTHNPCKDKTKGCRSAFKQVCNENPSASCSGNPESCANTGCTDEVFEPGKYPNSENCFHGTCNLIGDVKEYCDTIKIGQCLPPNQTYPPDLKPGQEYNPARNGPSPGHYPGCYAENKYTTYCFDYDDNNSSPIFVSPYKMKITYTDLAE